MDTLELRAAMAPDDSSRRALGRLTLVLLAGLGCTVLIVLLLIVAALRAVDVIDADSIAHERLQVERTVAAYGGGLNYVPLDTLRTTLDLDAARLTTRDALQRDELAVALGGDRVVAWMPHRFGTEAFRHLAPTRIALGLGFGLIVAMIALYIRRLGRQLDQRRQAATHLALTDSLTGRGNRLAFEAALAARLAAGESFALILADLDRFKAINDALGHAAGDLVLQHVAASLRQSGAVAAARLGGDEFAVLCPVASLEDYMAELHRRLATPVALEGRDVSIGISFGVARRSDYEATPEVLMRAADAALYCAKRRGGNATELAVPTPPSRRYAA